MALSLLVLLIPLAILIGIYRVVQGGDAPTVIDAAPTVAEARADGAFPVLVPEGLGGEWRTVSASYRPGDGSAVLRIGYLTPSESGIQLIESDLSADTLLTNELTTAARPEGAVRLADRDWQWYAARPGERALVLIERERTVVVIGSAGDDELRALAAALPR
jgi:Protein of unknown function (DUF4245)